MNEKAHILSGNDIARIIRRISHEILERNKGAESLVFIGLQKRGVPLAKRIAENIEKFEGLKIDTGKLDITFYRDDIGQNVKPTAQITDISFEIENMNVILVDDVLYTGRTIRADYVGKNLPTSHNELVEVKLEETDGEDSVIVVKKE